MLCQWGEASGNEWPSFAFFPADCISCRRNKKEGCRTSGNPDKAEEQRPSGHAQAFAKCASVSVACGPAQLKSV